MHEACQQGIGSTFLKPLIINGVRTTRLLDTGAIGCTISTNLAHKLNIKRYCTMGLVTLGTPGGLIDSYVSEEVEIARLSGKRKVKARFYVVEIDEFDFFVISSTYMKDLGI